MTTDEWWSSLRITEKERIGAKLQGQECPYPECSRVWLSLDEERKAWIRDHCTKDHGLVIPAWTEGIMYSE